MEILYSNILPLESGDNQETNLDCFIKQISVAERVDIAVGYISLAALDELDRLMYSHHNIQYVCLVIGMYFAEGMPEKTYHAAIKINRKWQQDKVGEIRIVKPFKYHGKVYCFYKNGTPFSAIIGSGNLSMIKLEANNRRLEKGIDSVKIRYSPGLQPTRKNVLDADRIETISGGTNYFPSQPDNVSIEDISKILHSFSEKELFYQVSLRLIQKILSYIIPSPDFRLEVFQSILESLLADNPMAQGILIVRRARDIAQGTGAMLSPNDWKLGARFTEQTVLTMYQVTGSKGWGGKQLWIPNIKLPSNTVYYDVAHEDEL